MRSMPTSDPATLLARVAIPARPIAHAQQRVPIREGRSEGGRS
jgi:hypothetical protein